jgi:hypothetical protein
VVGIVGSDLRRHRYISERTIDALARRRSAGVRFGRPRTCPDDTLIQVVLARESGARLIDIAKMLNAGNVRTPGGGAQWYPSHVSRLLKTQDAQNFIAEATQKTSNSADLIDSSREWCARPS